MSPYLRAHLQASFLISNSYAARAINRILWEKVSRSCNWTYACKALSQFSNMVLLRTGLDEGLNLSPWASLAKVACLKELYSGRSLFGAKGRGTTLSEVDYGAASCLPVVPILPEPIFMSNTFFNLFSSGRLVPPPWSGLPRSM